MQRCKYLQMIKPTGHVSAFLKRQNIGKAYICKDFHQGSIHHQTSDNLIL